MDFWKYLSILEFEMNKRIVKFKSPSKTILFGEHSVVYPGNKSLLVPLPIYTDVEIKQEEKKVIFTEIGTYPYSFSVSIHEIFETLESAREKYKNFLVNGNMDNLKKEIGNAPTYAKICVGLAYEYLKNKGVKLEPVNIKVDCKIFSSGLGSSASFANGVIRGIIDYAGVGCEKNTLYEIVHEAENFQHGRSSGADPAVIVYDEPIVYKNPQEIRALQYNKKNFEKFMTLLHIVNTGKPNESTGEMVEFVKNRYLKEKGLIDSIFESIDLVISEFVNMIESDHFEEEEIIELLNKNGVFLEELGVVNEKVCEMSRNLRSRGFGVKISGAGGKKTFSGALIVFGSNFDQKKLENSGFEAIF